MLNGEFSPAVISAQKLLICCPAYPYKDSIGSLPEISNLEIVIAIKEQLQMIAMIPNVIFIFLFNFADKYL